MKPNSEALVVHAGAHEGRERGRGRWSICKEEEGGEDKVEVLERREAVASQQTGAGMMGEMMIVMAMVRSNGDGNGDDGRGIDEIPTISTQA